MLMPEGIDGTIFDPLMNLLCGEHSGRPARMIGWDLHRVLIFAPSMSSMGSIPNCTEMDE